MDKGFILLAIVVLILLPLAMALFEAPRCRVESSGFTIAGMCLQGCCK